MSARPEYSEGERILEDLWESLIVDGRFDDAVRLLVGLRYLREEWQRASSGGGSRGDAAGPPGG